MKLVKPITLAALAALSTHAVAGDSTAQFRFFIPSDVPIQEESSSSQEAYTKAAEGTSGDFGVKIELLVSRDGGAFQAVPLATPVCNGDHVAFRFTPSAAGYATVVNHGTSGRWSRIWPARAGADPSFGPQQPVRLPAAAGAGFPLSGPPGDEYIMIFFSPGPFSGELEKLQDRVLALEEPSAAVADAITGGGTRAVQVTLMRDLGTAEAAYAVGQGEQTVAFALDHQASCGEL